MLLNYLKLSLRLLVRNPFFAVINVVGLAVGFAAFITLWQYSTTELKTDQYHKDYDRIGRIGCYWRWKEEVSVGQMTSGSIPIDQMHLIAADFSQIVDYTRIIEGQFRTGHNSPRSLMFSVELDGERAVFNESRVISADSNFFSFFTVPLIHGNKELVLRSPSAVVLSQRAATKYFGNRNPLNRTLVLNDTLALQVSGVFADLPSTTHLNFEVVLSNVAQKPEWESFKWGQCFVKLNEVDGFASLEKGINDRKKKYWAKELKRWTASDAEVFVQPLQEIAFSNHYWGDFFWPKSKFVLKLLVITSIVILVMAWINYNNLTLSRTLRRMKEVAARKVNGARSIDLVKQFIIESMVIHLIAIALALTIVQLIRTPLVVFFHVSIPEVLSAPLATWLVFILVMIGGIAVTALYPALVSISFNPRSLFKVNLVPGVGKSFSSALTTFQYTAAIVLLLWVSVVYSQLDFILHKDIGINKSGVFLMDAPAGDGISSVASFHSFMTELRKRYPSTYGHTLIGDEAHWRVRLKSPGHAHFFQVDSNGGIDETFIPFFGIRLLAGRNFIANDREDVIIVSRYITERLGYSNVSDVIGEMINVDDGKYAEMEVIGVMEDFNLRPFVDYGEDSGHPNKSREDGICLTFKQGNFKDLTPGKIAIRLDSRNQTESMATIDDLFQSFFPGSMTNWYFMDDHINRSYDQEMLLSNQIALITLLAIGISCLGLLGMMSSRVEEKIKEIGIRKVLGAGLPQISSVLLSTTVWQVVGAVALGVPFGYYLGHQYLERYSQRIDLQAWHFVGPVVVLLLIMLSVISSVLWKAARHNPVEALKYE